jgi:drug/metabolite transporter (DMT)-like permease
MNAHLRAHFALLSANLIYGLNFTVAKGVMPNYLQPFNFIVLRVSGALMLFYFFHRWVVREKILRSDTLRLIGCGATGVAANQLMFFSGLNLTGPINAAIVMTSNPVFVLLVSAFVLRERITRLRLTGIVLALSGALMLILGGKNGGSLSLNTGDLLILLNSASYALYLVMVKPLMQRYKPATVLTAVFFYGWCMVLPFGIWQLPDVQWSAFPQHIWWSIVFVVVCTTFLTYFLNVYALHRLSPPIAGAYIYTQPLFATFFALLMGKDTLGADKLVAAGLIFLGVFLVSGWWKFRS